MDLDVQQFKLEEITVKVMVENTITIESKHEEKANEYGHIYSHFGRQYRISKDTDLARIWSTLSSDGVLTVAATRMESKIEHKCIPKNPTEKKYNNTMK